MTTLAEDLLKSRTVYELRELVYTLEKDASSKKTELQHMVGSKYHDFIQSADKVSLMKTKAETIETSVSKFIAANRILITSTQELLQQTQPVNERKIKTGSNLEGGNFAWFLFI